MIKMFLSLILCLSCFTFSHVSASSEKVQAFYLPLYDHISKADVEQIQKELKAVDWSKYDAIVMQINSSSGDLYTILDLAKLLYKLKVTHNLDVYTYINNQALGPAALFPFLADHLAISHFVSWGDVILGQEAPDIPINQLRSQVLGLIPEKAPKAALLNLLARAMVDPVMEVQDDGRWQAGSDKGKKGQSMISRLGETMVLDHKQIIQTGLVKEGMSEEAFLSSFTLHNIDKSKVIEDANRHHKGLQPKASSIVQKLNENIHYNIDAPNTVGYLYIGPHDQGIDETTWIYVNSALEHYKKTKPIFIILELDTPGGEVFASQQISDALRDIDFNHGIPVVTVINNWAISAGAMLAYSTRFIAITSDASMGAAEPVFAGGQGGQMQSAPEKINSALRADFANRARFFNRNSLIAEAMVDKDLILVSRHDEVMQLESDDEIIRKGFHPDLVITTKGKLLTLDAEELIEFGVADLSLTYQKIKAITDEEKELGAWPAEKSLLFTLPFFQNIPQATIDPHEMTWRIKVFAWLANPAVQSLLFLGLMLGFYLEVNTPGFGLPGALALAALLLIVLSSVSVNAAGALEMIMLVLGMLLIALEVLVIPGFGIVGLLGMVLALVGLFTMMLPSLGLVQWTGDDGQLSLIAHFVLERLAWFSGTLIVGFIIIAILARYIVPKFSFLNRLVAKGEQNAAEGFTAAGIHYEDLPPLGADGNAFTSMRPSGKISVNDTVFDAMSDAGFIEKGSPIQVMRIEGSKIIVTVKE